MPKSLLHAAMIILTCLPKGFMLELINLLPVAVSIHIRFHVFRNLRTTVNIRRGN